MNLSKVGFWTFIVALFSNVVVWAFLPSLAVGGIAYLVLLGLSFVGLILWFVFSLSRIKLWFKQRSTQFGLSLLVMAVMTFVILAFVNWLAVSKNVKKDMTSNQLHTLSDQTRSIVSKLSEEVVLRVWSTNVNRMSPNLNMEDFLENYKIASQGKLKLEIMNPNENSLEAEQDQVRRDNVIVVKAMGSGREARVENFSDNKGEEQITNAIIQATKGRKKTVCFIQGHGQPSLSDSGPQGQKLLKDNLEASNYEIKETVLVNVESVPSECELLVNSGPRNAPIDREQSMLADYLKSGGAYLALFGPRTPDEWKKPITEPYGVEMRKDLLVDPFRPQNPVVIETRNYAQDVGITEGFALVSVFPETATMRVPLSDSEDLSVRTFVSSEGRTYAKAGEISSIRNLQQGGGDLRGPLPIAVLIEKSVEDAEESNPAQPSEETSSYEKSWSLFPTAHAHDIGSDHSHDDDGHGHSHGEAEVVDEDSTEKKTRIVLFSNDLFVINGVVKTAGNFDLFANAASFLLKDEELIGIRPRDIRQTFLQITVQDIRKVWGFVIIVAGIFVVFGVRAARRKSVLAA